MKVELRLDAQGIGTVILDGRDVSTIVTHVAFDARAGEPTIVTIDCRGELDADLDAQVFGSRAAGLPMPDYTQPLSEIAPHHDPGAIG